MPRLRGTLETVLYAEDLEAAMAFYRDVLRLAVISDNRPLSIGLRIAREQVLLIFDPRESSKPGRIVPSHGATGPGHAAWLTGDDDLWRDRLRQQGVAVEHEHVWAGGERSIYLRDPAGNSIELITGDIWASP